MPRQELAGDFPRRKFRQRDASNVLWQRCCGNRRLIRQKSVGDDARDSGESRCLRRHRCGHAIYDRAEGKIPRQLIDEATPFPAALDRRTTLKRNGAAN